MEKLEDKKIEKKIKKKVRSKVRAKNSKSKKMKIERNENWKNGNYIKKWELKKKQFFLKIKKNDQFIWKIKKNENWK